MLQVDMKSVLFIPSRWLLYCCTVPAIWWIIAHISSYTLRRKLYVVWLNVVMLLAGGLATIPHLSWGHKVCTWRRQMRVVRVCRDFSTRVTTGPGYLHPVSALTPILPQVFWMFISCVPFPELCFHMWRMISDAIEALPPSNSTSALPLHFMRCYGQFSYQFFPAIYFVAFDGCVPVHVTEPLWAICDWCLKMVMTSSLMEANFVSIEQRRAQAIAGREVMCRAANIKELSSAIARKGARLLCTLLSCYLFPLSKELSSAIMRAFYTVLEFGYLNFQVFHPVKYQTCTEHCLGCVLSVPVQTMLAQQSRTSCHLAVVAAERELTLCPCAVQTTSWPRFRTSCARR